MKNRKKRNKNIKQNNNKNEIQELQGIGINTNDDFLKSFMS